jgi:nucleoside-diphosphate-sugar epimerase
MQNQSYIVLGGNGLIGSRIVRELTEKGSSVISITRENYNESLNVEADVLINCNGNSFRYKANHDPQWDFNTSVESVFNSIFDFRVGFYVYISTVDIYNHRSDPECNHENTTIEPIELDNYGFHKWLAERVVEKYSNNSLILRLGTILGNGLKKGPIFDLLQKKPLHMHPDSRLTFINTSFVLSAIEKIMSHSANGHSVYNLTGTGFVTLSEIIEKLSLSHTIISGRNELPSYNYNINNGKIRKLFPLPSSFEVAESFVKQSLMGKKI